MPSPIRLLASALFAICLLSHRTSFGQIVYLPAQYQYGTQNTFYYGGTDPSVIARAAAPTDTGGEFGRVLGFEFVSGNRSVTNEPTRIFSDAIPLQNAAIFGYTISDARNAANESVPCYFRKADVIAAAKATLGVLVVPASATFPAVIRMAPTAPKPPQPLMILPKPTTIPSSDKVADASH